MNLPWWKSPALVPDQVTKENAMLTMLASSLPALLAQAEGGIGTLLYVGIVFFVIAIVAYVLGARGVAGMSAGIGRTLLMVFLVLAVILIIWDIVT